MLVYKIKTLYDSKKESWDVQVMDGANKDLPISKEEANAWMEFSKFYNDCLFWAVKENGMWKVLKGEYFDMHSWAPIDLIENYYMNQYDVNGIITLNI